MNSVIVLFIAILVAGDTTGVYSGLDTKKGIKPMGTARETEPFSTWEWSWKIDPGR
jgi:hypothetical protein